MKGKYTIMKATLLAVLAVLSVFALSGCASGSYTDPTETGTDVYDRGAGVSVLTVQLPDGRQVYCIDSGRGLDCDWEGSR